jgi:hypothetical protein
MEVDGINLAISSAALTALAGVAGAWIKARYGRTKVEPTPLPVDVADKFVTCDQCKAHREALAKRVDAQLELFSKVSDKLDLIEAHNEDRAKRMHDRLDPVIRSSAATAEVLKQHLEDHRAARGAGGQ